MRHLTRSSPRSGFLLGTTLVVIAVLEVLLGGYLTVITYQIRLAELAVARAQALYAAEAGVEAATELLGQRWDAVQDQLAFPMRGSVVATVDDREESIGQYDVSATLLGQGRVQLTASGRAGDGVCRTLSVVLVRRWRPVFQRAGLPPTALTVRASHLDQEGVPDGVEISPELVAEADESPRMVSAGSSEARERGVHLLAGLVDVDGDGDLDLVLSDAPSRDDAVDQRNALMTVEPMPDAATSYSTTLADLFHTGRPLSVTGDRMLFIPAKSIARNAPGTSVFFNQLVSDGMAVVSWAEILGN